MDNHVFRIEGFLYLEQVLLFQDWLIILAKDRFDFKDQRTTNGMWQLELPLNQSINISFNSDNNTIEVQTPIDIGPAIEELSQEACNKIKDKIAPPSSWWRINFSSEQNMLNQSTLLHMFRSMGSYKRGPEKLRMGQGALLRIDDGKEGELALLPKLNIEVIFASPGAPAGPFSRAMAKKMIPVFSAVLSGCFGTPLMPMPAIVPAKENEIEDTLQELNSDKLPDIGFQGLPIWNFLAACRFLGATELADRVIGAMMAYEAGMLQRTDHATLVFFVSAIEALTVPNLKKAKTQRLSKRFSDFLETFCSDDIEKVMNHANFSQAFGKITSKKRFIRELYNLRSVPIHTGHFGNYSGMMIADDQSLKIGLVNDIVVAAISALIKTPVTLLWGHPTFDPFLMIRMSPDEYKKLTDHKEQMSDTKKGGGSIEDYAKNLILTNIQ